MLFVIFNFIRRITISKSEPALIEKLYLESNLLEIFDGLFNLPVYSNTLNTRKDIYAFVLDFIQTMYKYLDQSGDLNINQTFST